MKEFKNFNGVKLRSCQVLNRIDPSDVLPIFKVRYNDHWIVNTNGGWTRKLHIGQILQHVSSWTQKRSEQQTVNMLGDKSMLLLY